MSSKQAGRKLSVSDGEARLIQEPGSPPRVVLFGIGLKNHHPYYLPKRRMPVGYVQCTMWCNELLSYFLSEI